MRADEVEVEEISKYINTATYILVHSTIVHSISVTWENCRTRNENFV
jgi:hypothetical protein